MSTGRPPVTAAVHPATVKFTNILSEEDMKHALSELPRSARTAIFTDRDEKALRFSNGEVLSPGAIKYFFENNRYIQHVRFYDVAGPQAVAIVDCVSSDKRILSLDLQKNDLTDRDLAALNTTLQTNTTLHTLDISDGEELNGEAVIVLHNTKLTALHTANNALNGCQAAALLNTHPKLLLLNISQNDLCDDADNSEDGVAAVVLPDLAGTAKADSPQSMQSHLSSEMDNEYEVLTDEDDNELQELPSPSLVALIAAINIHRSLREIHLMDCNLDTEFDDELIPGHVNLKKQLFTALFTHQTLTTINIAKNQLSNEVLRTIAFNVINRNKLTHLNMSACITRIKMEENDEDYPQTYMYMLDSVRMLFGSRLTHLYLAENHLGDNELALLRPQLRTNTTLVELCLANNNITNNGVQHLLPFLERTRTLQVLDLSHNPIRLKGLLCILDALQRNKNCAVHTLIFYSCSINIPLVFTEEDRNKFLKKIPRSLLHFNLRLNGISMKDANLMQGVKQKLQAHQTLLRFTQRVSPLIAFVRANVTHPYRGSVLPVIPEITENLGTGIIEIDIRKHRESVAAAAAKPNSEKRKVTV